MDTDIILMVIFILFLVFILHFVLYALLYELNEFKNGNKNIENKCNTYKTTYIYNPSLKMIMPFKICAD